MATNQGVVGSIPASRTKRKALKLRDFRAFSFVHHAPMSKAFTKESDNEDDEPTLPAIPVGGKNYITPQGYARLRAELLTLIDDERPKVVDIVRTLQAYHAQVDIYDPWIDTHEAQHEYGLQCLTAAPALGEYAAIILAVGHHQFVEWGEVGIKALRQPCVVLFDVKSILPLGAADGRL